MSHLFRTILLLISLVATAYFAIHWIGTALGEDYIYRPYWIKPNTEEPLTIFCGILSALVGVWERVGDYFSKFGGIKVHILFPYFFTDFLRNDGEDEIFIHTLTLSFILDNSSDRDLAIKDAKVFSLNKSSKINLPHTRITVGESNLVLGLKSFVPRHTTKTLEINFFNTNSKIDLREGVENEEFCLEITLANNKKITKRFWLHNRSKG